MANYKLLVAYDGTDYLGWQATRMGSSIEESLQTILNKILNKKCALQAASRTDAGVHAEGQVVNLHSEKPLDCTELKKSLNALLPKAIVVHAVEAVHETFHPTLDAKGKVYHYHLCNDAVQLPHRRFFSWHIPYPLDLNAMRNAASLFEGRHDFASFCNTPKNTHYNDHICTLERVKIVGTPHLLIEVVGSRFLYKMVRNIVGTLIYVGLGKLTASEIPDIFAAKARPRAGITAPARGLTLKEVIY